MTTVMQEVQNTIFAIRERLVEIDRANPEGRLHAAYLIDNRVRLQKSLELREAELRLFRHIEEVVNPGRPRGMGPL